MPFRDRFDCPHHSRLQAKERLPNTFRNVSRRHFRAAHQHLGVPIVSRYDQRLRNQQARAAVEDGELTIVLPKLIERRDQSHRIPVVSPALSEPERVEGQG